MKAREELLKLLDLEGKEALPVEATELAVTSTTDTKTSKAASPTALELDDWALAAAR